jgi:hypothetical protein
MLQGRAGGVRIGRDALAGLGIAGIFAWLVFGQSIFNDGDTSWHLASGRLILDTRSIPHTDPFSFTFTGHAWTAHEWLAEVAMALVDRSAGWAGVAILFAGAMALALGMIARELLRGLPFRYALLGLAFLVAVLAPFMLARPHVLTWPIFILWLVALLRARDEHRAPKLAWAAMMIVWANLHASYLIGLGIAAVFALEALIQEKDKRAVVTGWLPFGLASLLAAALTPHGIQGFLYPLQVSGMKSLPLIQEWRSSNLSDDLLFFVALASIAALAIVKYRSLTFLRLLLLAGLAVMAVLHSRHQPLFVMTAALLLARTMSASGGTPRLMTIFAIGLAAVSVVRLAMPLERGDSATYPASAIAHLPAELRSQPVFNSYGLGGPLILNGIRSYIDGRADMYGDEFTADHNAIVMGDKGRFNRTVDRFGIRWTILQQGSPLIAVLDRDPQWRRIYADRWVVVHRRR